MTLLSDLFYATHNYSYGAYRLFDFYDYRPQGESVIHVFTHHGQGVVSIDFDKGTLTMHRKPKGADVELVLALCEWAFQYEGGYEFFSKAGSTPKELLTNFQVFDIGHVKGGSVVLFPSYLSNPFAD